MSEKRPLAASGAAAPATDLLAVRGPRHLLEDAPCPLLKSDPGLTGAIDVTFFFASLHLDYNALAAAAFGLFEPEATAGADVDATGRSLAKLRLKYDEFFVCLCA